jgi:hypothetical protein
MPHVPFMALATINSDIVLSGLFASAVTEGARLYGVWYPLR